LLRRRGGKEIERGWGVSKKIGRRKGRDRDEDGSGRGGARKARLKGMGRVGEAGGGAGIGE